MRTEMVIAFIHDRRRSLVRMETESIDHASSRDRQARIDHARIVGELGYFDSTTMHQAAVLASADSRVDQMIRLRRQISSDPVRLRKLVILNRFNVPMPSKRIE